MIGQNVRCYVVSVNTEDDDPLIFGPYTERKARELASEFNDRVDENEFGFIHATATRIVNPSSVKALLAEFGQ